VEGSISNEGKRTKGKKLYIRWNAKYQRDMKVAIHVEEKIKQKVCKANSQKKSGGTGINSQISYQ
jgi:hypothetical protein